VRKDTSPRSTLSELKKRLFSPARRLELGSEWEIPRQTYVHSTQYTGRATGAVPFETHTLTHSHARTHARTHTQAYSVFVLARQTRRIACWRVGVLADLETKVGLAGNAVQRALSAVWISKGVWCHVSSKAYVRYVLYSDWKEGKEDKRPRPRLKTQDTEKWIDIFESCPRANPVRNLCMYVPSGPGRGIRTEQSRTESI
jgi:hypothetical protein